MSNIIAVIPARANSKGVPNKNILPLNNIPLIAYSIKAAQKSRYIDRIIVSTDSEEYANISREYGAETPFLRPDKYSQDHSNDIEFLKHMLDWIAGMRKCSRIHCSSKTNLSTKRSYCD